MDMLAHHSLFTYVQRMVSTESFFVLHHGRPKRHVAARGPMVAPIAGRESTRTEKVQLIQPEPQSTDSGTHDKSLIQRLLPIDYREALHQVSTMGSTAIGRPGLRIMLNRKENGLHDHTCKSRIEWRRFPTTDRSCRALRPSVERSFPRRD